MRLINTSNLDFEEFKLTDAPPYAILSHTWVGAETSYQDVLNDRKAGRKTQYTKLIEGCRAAEKHGFKHFWIDTCCIDKTNHVELSEAINSMFKWYRQAGICLAYLADVSPTTTAAIDLEPEFAKSKWFERGWTLQELIAPLEVESLASDWSKLTSKTELCSTLALITGIPSEFLLGKQLGEASVAMRMSWASNRITTKAEDIAYCLMGIFDLHMPLLYGKGEGRAFRRLQQEIINELDDHSIFAWTANDAQWPPHASADLRTVSVLAWSPECFRQSNLVVEAEPPFLDRYVAGIRAPTAFNNKGLHMALPIISKGNRRVVTVLDCGPHGKEDEERFAIWLRDVSVNGGRYVRVDHQKLETLKLAEIMSLPSRAKYSYITITRGKDEDFTNLPGDVPVPEVEGIPGQLNISNVWLKRGKSTRKGKKSKKRASPNFVACPLPESC
ncbi:hypothetical protein E8E12_004304 [Didymella heteroderae]|uniref:Heterokaryon incompatibility domain-containing protein n=1 Tax=Didymella heteroderae TaxID=1769908 RepID=A0A9P4WLL8_9PLEO|nr:hypothetical protein E8E12_004304 [Didymella heteroderae]